MFFQQCVFSVSMFLIESLIHKEVDTQSPERQGFFG